MQVAIAGVHAELNLLVDTLRVQLLGPGTLGQSKDWPPFT
ncbi:hypothetical protein FACS1894130_12010 [Spirochaetia bacterium]|nr:hypothetical protein FACS1894130_12010 [Spirochaetia bacterium]